MSCINNQTVTFQDKTRFRYQFEDSKGEIGDWMFVRAILSRNPPRN
jgi:hypothetical protein